MIKRLVLVLVFAHSLCGSVPARKPRVSIITSVYNGDQFIEGFLADIVKQTIFDECELIMINAASPGNEETVIKRYMVRYPNIIYKKLIQDPGLYAVWNMAIAMASADFITNANLDDRRNHDSLRIQAEALESNNAIDLVYGNYLITYTPNETYASNTYRYIVDAWEFSPEKMYKCLPGPFPMWRKSLHDQCGYFNELLCSAGDWELWNRAVRCGSQFLKIEGIFGLYYDNPQGLSTDCSDDKKVRRDKEHAFIMNTYRAMWQW